MKFRLIATARPMRARLGLLLTALLMPATAAQQCGELADVGSLGGQVTFVDAMSSDGQFVVGQATLPSGATRAFRRSRLAGLQDLGTIGGAASIATGVSADGSVVVGNLVGGLTSTNAFIWTELGGMQLIPATPGDSLNAQAVSADGTTVVGFIQNVNVARRAFRWTAAGGVEVLDGSQGVFAMATDVSANGQVVVGFRFPSASPTQSFRWTSATGMVDIVGPAGQPAQIVANAVSDDGDTVVGSYGTASSTRAFRWTAAGGLEVLDGNLNGVFSDAKDVSANGDVVVGNWFEVSLDFDRAFRWNRDQGAIDMGPIDDFGGVEAVASGVSGDGSVVAGTALTQTQLRGFRVQLSPVGRTYCRPLAPNSSGCGGILLVNGTPAASGGTLELAATSLPANVFALFLASRAPDLVPGVAGGPGTLCLGGPIGRFMGPGQVTSSGPNGRAAITIAPGNLPTPTGLVAAQPGETWYFQGWHRDLTPGPSSNFTDAVSVTLD